ncbi:MAG: hypothetical protein ABGW97_14135 [Christiangramia sp.]|uniref:hypothetical protein n=1 Tax=Christiangramia sp. TaxID=1931228 RepID=UPI003242398A
MRNLQILLFVILMGFSALAQDKKPVIGDRFVLHVSEHHHLESLLAPQKNFILKKNGVVNFKSLHGVPLYVSAVKTKKAYTRLILKRLDGRKFFNAFSSISVNYEQALELREIQQKN